MVIILGGKKMRKEGKGKLMPILVTLVLLVSVFLTVPQGIFAATTLRVQYDRSSLEVYFNETDTMTIHCLTPGDDITVRVTDGTLTKDEEYTLSIWDGTKNVEIISGDADANGDISFDIAVPGYRALGDSVIGEHNLTLWEGDMGDTEVDQVIITIGNYYKVKMKVGTEYVTHLYHGYEYDNLVFEFYNWTGEKKQKGNTYYRQVTDANYKGIDLAAYLFYPNGSATGEFDASIGNGKWSTDGPFDYIASDKNLETFYWLNVSNNDPPNQYSNVTIPIKFVFDKGDAETTYKWDEDIEIEDCYFKIYDEDNKLTYASAYGVKAALYAPTIDGYERADLATISSKGYADLDANAGEYAAGTWYLGTYLDKGIYRLNETYAAPYIAGFIPYYSFKVTTDDSAVITIEKPTTDIISGFNQTINVSIADSWDGDYYEDMWLHFTGLKCWYEGYTNATGGHLFEADDVVVLGSNTSGGVGGTGIGTKTTGTKIYFEFNITFKESGTNKGIFRATYSYNNTDYTNNNGTYFESGIAANITGEKTFSVLPSGDINVVITDVPTAVLVETTGVWQNDTSGPNTIINVYGEDEDIPMNATIEITGCGIDLTIEEDEDTVDLSKGYKCADGVYLVHLQPKEKGTLTFTITNGTDGYKTTKDCSVNGLTIDTVTTSVGDDLEITVEKREKLTMAIKGGDLAEVHVSFFDEKWDEFGEVNASDTDEEYEGGLFEFYPVYPEDEEFLSEVGYLVIAAEMMGRYCYEIIEVVPNHDLEINIITPKNLTAFTVGFEQEIVLQVLNPGGNPAENIEDDDVIGEIQNSEGDVIQTVYFDDSGDEWVFGDDTGEIFWFAGTLVITATNNSGENEHDGNITFDVELAKIYYNPDTITCGIELEDVDITVTTEDANGNPLPEGTKLFLNVNATCTTTDPANGSSITLDENGAGEFTVTYVGDETGKINATFKAAYAGVGNYTSGELTISFPEFDVDPDEIYINEPNVITITATDAEGNPLPKSINLTLYGRPITQPDPVEIDEDGMVVFSVTPTASGKVNVTIARDVKYVGGELNWTNAVITDTYITVTARREMTIEAKSPVYEGETLTVTIKTGTTLVEGVNVKFNETTRSTGADGVVTFNVPDPGVESATYYIEASKKGYYDASKGITVIKIWEITITGPTGEVDGGSQFTVSVMAKGSALAGATITLEGTDITATSDGEGKATLTAPKVDKKTPYTVSATYENYNAGSTTVTIKPAGIPGFELITLIAAIGVAFILLRRRRK